MNSRSNRKQEILEAFAFMLQSQPGSRITTANLAKHIGVSEAALYRHFPSKAKMLEGLIEFIEESLFSRINRIQKGDVQGGELAAADQCGAILWLVLSFAEQNPGFTRLLAGDALQGETDRLRARMRQVFDRLETHLRNTIRDQQHRTGALPKVPAAVAANLLLATVEGRISQFLRSDFRAVPTADWEDQWAVLRQAVF